VVIISADVEWRTLKTLFPDALVEDSLFGEWFEAKLNDINYRKILFYHGGWGKISAAAATQYIIDHCHPALIINLGTCGGFEGEVERGTIILVNKTIVYDIIEQMGDFDAHIAHYTTEIDLSWLESDFPHKVLMTLLVSGDRDLLIQDIPELQSRYGAKAGDWESGAIAFVSARNRVKLLILRGVTDLVGSSGGEAYGDITFFENATISVMKHLVDALPSWIRISNIP